MLQLTQNQMRRSISISFHPVEFCHLRRVKQPPAEVNKTPPSHFSSQKKIQSSLYALLWTNTYLTPQSEALSYHQNNSTLSTIWQSIPSVAQWYIHAKKSLLRSTLAVWIVVLFSSLLLLRIEKTVCIRPFATESNSLVSKSVLPITPHWVKLLNKDNTLKFKLSRCSVSNHQLVCSVHWMDPSHHCPATTVHLFISIKPLLPPHSSCSSSSFSSLSGSQLCCFVF